MLENVLDKRDDENDFEYHKRLINGKLKDKTLSDYDYAELSPYVYGKQYTADETRKRMYGSAATLEVLESSSIKNITDNDILNEISVKKMELQKERQQFFDQRRELNKILNSEGRRDHLYDMLIQAANNIPKEVGLISADDSIESVTVSENEAVIVLCDWHYGMVHMFFEIPVVAKFTEHQVDKWQDFCFRKLTQIALANKMKAKAWLLEKQLKADFE